MPCLRNQRLFQNSHIGSRRPLESPCERDNCGSSFQGTDWKVCLQMLRCRLPGISRGPDDLGDKCQWHLTTPRNLVQGTKSCRHVSCSHLAVAPHEMVLATLLTLQRVICPEFVPSFATHRQCTSVCSFGIFIGGMPTWQTNKEFLSTTNDYIQYPGFSGFGSIGFTIWLHLTLVIPPCAVQHSGERAPC